MARKKRTDNKGIVLKVGEMQRKQDGRYLFRYTDNAGKRATVYASTLAELRSKEKQIEQDLRDGINTAEAEKTTLNQLFAMYMDIKTNLHDSTSENYLMMWKNNVQNSFLGGMKIANIKKMHIDKLYAELGKKGLAKNSIKFIHSSLKPCLQMAVDNDLIRKNPAAKIEITGEEKIKDALSLEQQVSLLEFVKENTYYNIYYPMLVIALGTALRVGELTGLTWKDIDLKRKMLSA